MVLAALLLACTQAALAAADTTFITPYERSAGKRTATYDEVMSFYKKLKESYTTINMGDMGPSDNGYPLRYVAYTNDGKLEKEEIRAGSKLVILVNNGIHAGEPDGIDASMMLLRDAATGKIKVPDNIVLVVVPAYNIGGMLNRSSHSRANQNGPESYGFRGNARNLDLNRDFIKCDAAETLGLEDLFNKVNPDIFVDNHVSDGADYQHVMTLLETQHNKLGGETGTFMHNTLTPHIYKDMKTRGYDLVPYVNDFNGTPNNGWREFYELPRFASGYAALFQTIAYVPETHMLKPFKDRVLATYALMQSIIKTGSEHAAEIKLARANDRKTVLTQKEFPLDWRCDTTRCDTITFKGYEASYKTSEVSGLPRLYYDRKKPFTKRVPFYNEYVPSRSATAPRAYIIPKAWTPIIICLRANGVRMQRINYDSTMMLTAYHIDNYETSPRPYERHYPHKNIQVTAQRTSIQVTQGDYIIWTNQPARRYLVETLEPTAPDAFFVWNYFDGILQQKEYFSDYVFEDVAAELLKKDPTLKKLLDEERAKDPEFAKSAEAQLYFVYRHSPYYEPGHMRYPIYRLEE
ncbi:M14 family metallopeptidase [Nemorincola caseinilytica]|uniref:M14 family metallopeptidase n=1 Tax=Nemorincola caseinilytica TaxID=2054315 RepID=A0ABP8NN17_9BACT